MGSPLLSMSFVKQLTILIGFGVYLRAGYAAGHQKPSTPGTHPRPKTPNNPQLSNAETGETGFWRFCHYAPWIFWQSIPETPNQPDAVDEPDAAGAPQGLETHGLRRPRRVRRVQLVFIIPPGMAPFAARLSQYICLGIFSGFHIGATEDIARRLLTVGRDLVGRFVAR
jgi:hypothetical protein